MIGLRGVAKAPRTYRSHASEHLGRPADEFRGAERQAGSTGRAVEALRGSGNALDLLKPEPVSAAQEFIADNELLDPESPDRMLDPIARHGLAKSLAKGRAIFSRLSPWIMGSLDVQLLAFITACHFDLNGCVLYIKTIAQDRGHSQAYGFSD